jgi:hypothetical protein
VVRVRWSIAEACFTGRQWGQMAIHEFQGGRQSTCQTNVGMANISCRDQRASLLHLHGLTVGPVPLSTPARSVRKKARSSRAALVSSEESACFRLRFADGHSAPALFLPSLRLCSTFPFAEPEAEAKNVKWRALRLIHSCHYCNYLLALCSIQRCLWLEIRRLVFRHHYVTNSRLIFSDERMIFFRQLHYA